MIRLLILTVLTVFLSACDLKKEPKLFLVRGGHATGIDFQNTIETNDTLHALSFEYIYNGSGIGVGDFNNDGLEDLFFGGNQVSSELYLNKGNLQFEKVTLLAGVETDRWVTGVSVIDINADGLLDIYLCVGGLTEGSERKNLLFINQGLKDGVPVFEEMAAKFGLDDDSYSTMAAFFDYDGDGDADMYLLNNWLERYNRNNIRPKRVNGEAESTDKLYRNNGDGTFSDVSKEAGILIEGYGLGITICDINNDSWPDVYVANDFLSNDLLWLNQGNGTFRNVISDFLKHQTHNAMGVDIADFNNDALPDIVVVDMLPPGHHRQKMMTAGQNYDHFHMSVQNGYEPQYMRNTLQLNRGNTSDGKVLFSEIAFHAGIAQTDWSWAPLFADFDNDGWKDLFVANGYRKDVTNVDFIFFGLHNSSPYGSPGARKKITQEEFSKLEDVKISNFIFRNTGTLKFEDKTRDWGLLHETFSNGAVYADLDNDGDLDIVTNNIDQEVVVYENRSANRRSITLLPLDTASFNHKVSVYIDGNVQFQEYTPYRGFQSTVTSRIHFGLGLAPKADSVVIIWQDGRRIIYKDVFSGTALRYSVNDAVSIATNPPVREEASFLLEKTQVISYSHRETSPSDIKITRTLIHELSRNGPSVAIGDINNDSLDDLFIGGEPGIPAKLFTQQRDGTFTIKNLIADSAREDGAAVFFDANNDGYVDLYVASSGQSVQSESAQHILLMNDGNGNLTPADVLPSIRNSSKCVVAFDYDGDGDLDLFVGGDLLAEQYPASPRSYLLENRDGTFIDVTESVAPGLFEPGLITAALSADFNKDGRPDLIVGGHWMPLRIFINRKNGFFEETDRYGLSEYHGWWNCLISTDVNGDGYPDIVAGNAGTNTFFKPSLDHPVKLVAKDFDGNGSIDPLVTYYNETEKERYLVHNRLVLIDQIPSIKKRFETFSSYASRSFDRSFTKDELKNTIELKTTYLKSSTLLNEGGKSFRLVPLPETTQLSTINDMKFADLDGDGKQELIAIGNRNDRETLYGNLDASIGTILSSDGKGNWIELDPLAHHFVADGDSRKLATLQTSAGMLILVLNNNEPSRQFLLRKMRRELAGR